jgi:hypothetical protein
MSTAHETALALRLKLYTARGILGDALDGVQRALAMLDEVSGELEEQNLASIQAKLDDVRERAAPSGAVDGGSPGAPPTIGDKPAPVHPHHYPGVVGGVFKKTTDCAHGCGAWMGGSRSGAPVGVDPFGECPKAVEEKPAALPQDARADRFPDPRLVDETLALLMPTAPPLAPAEAEPFKLSAPESAPTKRERAERPMPADWAPKSSTRIRLATLGIDVGPNSKVLVAYREAVKGQTRKTWNDKDFEAWAKAQHRRAGEQAAGAVPVC